MSDFREIPLPEENPLNVVVEDEAVVAAPKPKTRKKKATEETPAPAEGAEA